MSRNSQRKQQSHLPIAVNKLALHSDDYCSICARSLRLWIGILIVVLLIAAPCILFFDYLQLTYHTSYQTLLTAPQHLARTAAIRSECATLGIPRRVDVPQTFSKVEAFNGHTFAFPAPLDHYSLCIPSKNGNRNFGGLFYKLWNGEVPANLSTVTKSITDRQFERLVFDREVDRLWMVSRNPYARALSTYLDKIYCSDCANTRHSYKGFFATFHKQNVTFEEFMVRLQAGVVKGAFFPQLISPIQRGKNLCYLNHHLCLQSACLFKMNGHHVRVLKLEEQSQWFAKFAKCFNIKAEQIVGDEWTKFSKQPCFYSPTASCNDSLATPTADREVATNTATVGGVHGKAATNKIDQFYTPKAAAIVNYLYAYDFQVLGLQMWDGTGPFMSR